jgi:transcriptional regulator of acetoin/glycerol metabolism
VEREVQHMGEASVRAAVLDRFSVFVKQHADYTWPGNVRELHGVVRTLALGLSPRLRHSRDRAGARIVVPRTIAAGTSTLRAVQAWYCRHVAARTRPLAQAAKVLDIDRGTLRGHLADDGDAS